EWVASRAGSNAVVAILTADHLMADVAGFRRTLASAAQAAEARPVMALIGIKPSYPATGYGYVELGGPAGGRGFPAGFRKVARFVEKPNLGTAATYVKSGRFVWNSGMFVWRVSTFREALARHRPVLLAAMKRIAPAFGSPRALAAALRREYPALEKISVDYAVMEKADNLVAARGDFGWDDVGSWTNAGGHFPADASGNAVYGAAQLLAASDNVVVNAGRGHLVAVMGASDLVVVHTDRATLVCTRAAAPGLKSLVSQIAADPATADFVK
ncbi:MAG: mannose-1-phosphate guanylyltransferase, partial [Kiritimatiellae bacterium]|nr:mannose-1-phosphate guanylyltransferase [Kiritimatiellia bacterium]